MSCTFSPPPFPRLSSCAPRAWSHVPPPPSLLPPRPPLPPRENQVGPLRGWSHVPCKRIRGDQLASRITQRCKAPPFSLRVTRFSSDNQIFVSSCFDQAHRPLVLSFVGTRDMLHHIVYSLQHGDRGRLRYLRSMFPDCHIVPLCFVSLSPVQSDFAFRRTVPGYLS